MIKFFVLTIVYYIAIMAIWIYSLLIPYGKKILLHIQNHVNQHTDLDLLYCGKQVLFGLLWTIALAIVAQVILVLFCSLDDK